MDQSLIANLLTIGGFLVMITIYVVNARNAAKLLGGRLEFIDATLVDFKIEIKKLQEVMIALATQDLRISNLEQRVTAALQTINDRMLAEGKRVDALDAEGRKLNR